MKVFFLFLLCHLLTIGGFSQISWHNPANDSTACIQGQGWPEELRGQYIRFPQRAKGKIRPEVWRLSRNSSGLAIHFYSNAPKIVIRYQVEDRYAASHIPATGRSGIDLYARDINGEELWCAGKYSFKDTISYTFDPITYRTSPALGYEYHLYLPPYNTVKWLEIGVPENSTFSYAPLRQEKPIVVYGTSIAQGACASRPGMMWTSILGRRLDHPVINLGFSGNGRLEKEALNFITEIDASLFILDCMPNLPDYPVKEIEKLLIQAVQQIRAKYPETPILFTEHDGYANQYTDRPRAESYQKTNRACRNAFSELQRRNIPQLYYLSCEEIAMPQDGTVDGVHASDYGMIRYAEAYEKKIREILRLPIGSINTCIPVRQRRDFMVYDWNRRHATILQLNRRRPPRAVILGNSITHFWGGIPESNTKRGDSSWKKYMAPAGFYNLGFGWDKIENMLWRVYHGELEGYRADKIILLAGTNNLQSDTDKDILSGLEFLLQAIRNRQPQAEIVVWGILPRRQMEKRIEHLNRQIQDLANRQKVKFADPGRHLLTPEGHIDESLFTDGLHPNKKGYRKLCD